jgi:hypothetical protein
MGIAPMLWLHSIDPAVNAALRQFSGGTESPAPVVHTTQAPRLPVAATVARTAKEEIGR